MAARTELAAPQPPVESSLDALLTGTSGPRRLLPTLAGLRLGLRVAAQPGPLVRHGVALAGECARIVAGRSAVAPLKGDRRFTDPAWQGNPLLRRLCQAYLAGATEVEGAVDDLELDWREEARVRFVVQNLVDALAPTNNPLLNPAALKAVLDTGGKNLLDGGSQLVRDVARRRTPAMVDEDAFTVGKDLAITPGSVVLRTPLFELIQYRPQTEQVRELPLLLVPPMINKYYVADLAPRRSMVEHYVQGGQQVFAMSWRNPGQEHRGWGLDDYAAAVLQSLDAALRITGAPRAHLLGLCAGGITSSVALAHLAATEGLGRVAGLTLGVTVLDQQRAGTLGSFIDADVVEQAIAESGRKGFLDGQALAGVFAWLRPNDLVWNYWVNNYLLGKRPPAFDVLYWNADSTRMPAGLHRDFLRMSVANALVTPGAITVLGSAVDLGAVDCDSYVVAGVADHICPWQSCYRSTDLLGGTSRFVLSTSGHIAALVNPPGNPKSTYSVVQGEQGEQPVDAEEWQRRATTLPGTWWSDHLAWLGERSGELREAPAAAGGTGFRVLGEAPGTYVHDR